MQIIKASASETKQFSADVHNSLKEYKHTVKNVTY